jgi:hypothetical protein
MKNIFLLFFSLFLFSCAEPNAQNQETEKPVVPKYEITSTTNWEFEKKSSDVRYKRKLDQKATKKKVKLFGAWVDMELGPVKLDMKGNVVLTEGDLSDENGAFKAGRIVFDMSTFMFAREKGQGLFNVKDYPNSTLEFLSFRPVDDSLNNYSSKVRLTIQEHAEEFEIDMSIITEGEAVKLKSKFAFNTLDFPLRDNTTKKEVNMDRITVYLDLVFTKGATKTDSLRIN